eukprot:scaffold273_cov349-Prasinococcus_capsulatus_cf.AAC.11
MTRVPPPPSCHRESASGSAGATGRGGAGRGASAAGRRRAPPRSVLAPSAVASPLSRSPRLGGLATVQHGAPSMQPSWRVRATPGPNPDRTDPTAQEVPSAERGRCPSRQPCQEGHRPSHR